MPNDEILFSSLINSKLKGAHTIIFRQEGDRYRVANLL
jgi:hypothetical protein